MAGALHVQSTTVIFTPPLVVFTSRLSNPLLSDTPLTNVGIVRSPPRWRLPYELTANLYVLAPSAGMMIVAREQGREAFVERYLEKLERVGADEVIRLLRCMQGDSKGLALLCFEDIRLPDRWCHRSILASWLQRETGLNVQELPDDSAPRRKKKPKPPLDDRQLSFGQ
jgi:uncharacterized protein DUF488